jgi:pilus assembly protein CpaD
MSKIISTTGRKLAGATVALSLGLALAGCGGMADNRSVESIHQPVVERTNYTLDLTTVPSGLPVAEQKRLDDWFEAMDLRYGDRIAIDDPLSSPATYAAVEDIAARHGVLLSKDAPVTQGYVNAGSARIVVSRFKASVPGCPDWSAKSDTNLASATSPNFGCSNNSNLAAMIADPEHLVRGATVKGDTVVMSSNKAIDAYRQKAPTGTAELKAEGTK